MIRRCLFAGSFDPFHNGHAKVVKSALTLFDECHVLVAINANKKALLTQEQRVQLILLWSIEQKLQGRLFVHASDDLTVLKAQALQCTHLVRGVRNQLDFAFEWELAEANRVLAPAIETILLPAAPETRVLSASFVRELLSRRLAVDDHLPPAVCSELKKLNFGR